MGVSRAADMYYTYRFLKTLVTDWKDMDAYDEGIIDENGTNLIKYKDLKTNDQKDAYTTFHRLVFNLKRILEKVPFGRSRLASYAAALYLLREETGMEESDIMDALETLGYRYHEMDEYTLTESNFSSGQYMLNITIDENFRKGNIVTIPSTEPAGKFSNTLVYKTTEGCFVTFDNLT